MDKKHVEQHQKLGFEYFMAYTNLELSSSGFGLVVDHSLRPGVASIAATGFMLSSLVIGVKNDYIEHNQAKDIAKKTLQTMINLPNVHGWIAHFLDLSSGTRLGKTEYSTIDTALAYCGILSVDSFFDDEEIHQLSKILLDRLDWSWLIHEKDGIKRFFMAYNPDKEGDYVSGKPGFIHHWGMFAEQLMMYVIMAGSYDKDLAYELYQGFARERGTYQDISYIYSPGNSLFVYQFPLAWLNLKGIHDQDGICWYENAQKATLAHALLSQNIKDEFPTFAHDFFGFSASDSPKGYRVFGGLPNHENKVKTDGTASTFAMIGSLPLTPDLSYKAICAMEKLPDLWGPYGFYDAFNLAKEPWYSKRYISINKGLELLMINAYLSQDVYQAFMSHPIIKKGMEGLKWVKHHGGNAPSSIKSIL
jgi:hypothetical protein